MHICQPLCCCGCTGHSLSHLLRVLRAWLLFVRMYRAPLDAPDTTLASLPLPTDAGSNPTNTQVSMCTLSAWP